MDKNNKSHQKRDLLLVTLILFIAAVGLIINLVRQKAPSAFVEIRIDGALVETLDLSQDTEITIDGYNHGTNHLVVQGGQVWIDDASCPDKICIHQGKISLNSDIIVCLPNLMTAQIRAEED